MYNARPGKKSQVKMGRKPQSSYSLIDSQSIKTIDKAESRGIDERKKMKGHKRHIITDTQGHLLHVKVHAANIHDPVSGCTTFEEAIKKYPTVKGVCNGEFCRKYFEKDY